MQRVLGEEPQVCRIQRAGVLDLESTAQDLKGRVHMGDVGDRYEQRRRAVVQRPGCKGGQQVLRLCEMLEHVNEESGTNVVDAVERRFQ